MKKLALLSTLLLLASCVSLRDEYAFMAKEYSLSHNQRPYIDAVRAIDAAKSTDSLSSQHARIQYPFEKGSILYSAPYAPAKTSSQRVHCRSRITYPLANCD